MKKNLRKSPSAKQSHTPEKAARKKENTGYFLAPFLITVIALAVESFLVFSQKTGVFGIWIYNVLVGTFGFAAYFIPVGALIIAFLFNGIAENKNMLFKCITLTVFCFFLASLNSIVSVDGLNSLPVSIPDYFVKGYGGEGGGVIGGLLGKLLVIAVGNVFAVIISVIACILSLTLFIGTTKAGVWYYLKELRMFGAEKTANEKTPPKAPEKISSKENGNAPDVGAAIGQLGNVPASFGKNNDPFRFGTEIGKMRDTMSIDLRSPDKQEPESVRNIYTEEREDVGKDYDIKIRQPNIQFDRKNGQAYSPFADPFIKKEDFIRNGARDQQGTDEPRPVTSRAYSPFNPFTKKDHFDIRDSGMEEEIKTAASTAFADSGCDGVGIAKEPSHISSGIPDFNFAPPAVPPGIGVQNPRSENGLPHSIQAGGQLGNTQNGLNTPLQGGLNTPPQNGLNTPPQSGVNAHEIPQNTIATGQGLGVSQNTDVTSTEGVSFGAIKNNADAPWNLPVDGGAPLDLPAFNVEDEFTEYLDDEYEDGEDESTTEETDAVFVSRERFPSFDAFGNENAVGNQNGIGNQNGMGSQNGFAGARGYENVGGGGYGDGQSRYDRRDSEEEQGEYRDRSEKLYPNYVYPSSVLLEQRPMKIAVTEEEVIEVRDRLLSKLASFKIDAKMVGYSAGPTITRYEIEPGQGVTVKSITNRVDDIALALQVESVQMATVPGKSVIGVEVPNKEPSIVSLRSLIENRQFMEAKNKITVCVGLTVTGAPVYMNIAEMPHVLIAGQTSSGKSVAMNCILLSLLYRATPDEVQLILIDPKRVEFSMYADIPHLIVPVIDESMRAAAALHWVVDEMDRRYQVLRDTGVRNRDEYYEKKARDPSLEYLPYIVIVIDELADLMLEAREHVDSFINRIAAKARACGIYLIVGTQRPSVDVITGLIKANIPARIAFQVATGNDSRTIFDTAGAEKLIGKGDMIYQATGKGKVRLQGAFASSEEVDRVVGFIIENNGAARYDPEVIRQLEAETERISKTGKKQNNSPSRDKGGASDFDYELICDAMEIVFQSGVTSKSFIQRRMHCGYNKSANIVDQLEELGFLSPRNGSKPGEILISEAEFMEWKMRNAP